MTDEDSPDLTVREYRPSDDEAVWTVHEKALRASPISFVEEAPADEDLRNVEAAYDDGTFLVGVHEGTVVAVGGFEWRSDDAVEIQRVRVHPDHQRRGFGRRLLDALEARAVQRGARRAVLETHERLAAARKMYEERGYREVDREPMPGGDFDVIRYETDL